MKASLQKCFIVPQHIAMCVALFFLSSCALSQTNSFFTHKILKPCTAHDYRIFDIVKTTDQDTLMQRHCIIYRTKGLVCIGYLDSDKYYLFAEDALKIVDFRTQELTDFVDDANVGYNHSIKYYKAQYLDEIVEHFYPLVYQDHVYSFKYKPLSFSEIKDSVIDGIPYKVLSRDNMSKFFFNDSTKQFDIPNFHTVEYYYNIHDESLQYIISRPMDYPNNKAFDYGIVRFDITISYEDKLSYIDSLFDFNDPQYCNFSKHNNTDNLPKSWLWHETRNTLLTDEVLDYPIVSLNNDTTSIRQQYGWVLIDFWFTGCRPCIEEMQKISTNESYIDLEFLAKHSINFMMINPIAGSSHSIKPIGDKYQLTNIIYHSKGLSSVFNIKEMPRLILISPNKKDYYDIPKENFSNYINKIIK